MANYALNDKEDRKFRETTHGHAVAVINDDGSSITSPISGFGLFKVDTDGSDTYITKEKADGEWMIMKIDSSTAATYATVSNNPSITSATDAQAAYLTLTYDILSVAF